jgi:hypothetical protein
MWHAETRGNTRSCKNGRSVRVDERDVIPVDRSQHGVDRRPCSARDIPYATRSHVSPSKYSERQRAYRNADRRKTTAQPRFGRKLRLDVIGQDDVRVKFRSFQCADRVI